MDIEGLGYKISLNICGWRTSATFAKRTFWRKSGIEPRRLVLTYKGVELEDNRKLFTAICFIYSRQELMTRTIGDLRKYRGQVLYISLRPEEPKVLGIGVGGSTKQDITPDGSDRRLWDMANSKIVNVQVLNTVTFKSLTGLEPPQTPVRADNGPTLAAEVSLGQSHSGISAQGAFDGLQGVDAWKSRPIIRQNGVAMLAEPGESVDGYASNGERLASDEVAILDVDDTFPRLSLG